MIITVFRSRLMPGLREEYIALVDAWSNWLRPCQATFPTKVFSPKTANG